MENDTRSELTVQNVDTLYAARKRDNAASSARRVTFALSSTILVAASLQLFNLGEKSFWIDELLSLNHAGDIKGWTSFLAPSSGDWHPPLYFLLLKGWLLLGGGETWDRLLSVLLGLGVIPAVYVLARHFFSIQVSLLSSFLVAVSPLFLLYDREVRNYPLFTLLSITSLFFFVQALREGRPRDWIGYTVFTVLNTYTHYHAFLLILGEVAFFSVYFSTYRQRLKALVGSLGIMAVAYLPMVPTLLIHLRVVRELEGQEGRFPVTLGYVSKPLYDGFAFALGQTILPWNPMAIVGAIVVLVFLIFGILALRRQRQVLGLFACCLFLPVLVGTLFSDAMPRYYLFLAPLFYIFLAVGMMGVPKARIRYLLAAVLAIVWGVGIRNYYENREFHILATVDPWREVGQFLKSNVSNRDVILHIALKPQIQTEPLSYYAGFRIPIRDADVLEILPHETQNGTIPRLWLIVSESSLQEVGRNAADWLAFHYASCTEQRYYHDPDYLIKKRFFRKDFSEYRIRIFRFENPQAGMREKTVCQAGTER
jgi:uncharacterized membrane protein